MKKRPRFRVHRQVYYTSDMFDSPPYATLQETHASWCVQMRILGLFWVTIREFDFEDEAQSECFAHRLLKEIQKF